MNQSVMLAQLNEQVEYLRGLLVGLEDQQLAKPPGPGKMSLKQTAVHLAHTDLMFAERIEQMLELDQPPVKVIDAALEDLESYKAADLDKTMEQFSNGRKRLIERLGKLYPQEWESRAVHPEYQNYNVQMAVEHLLLHEAHHLYGMEQLRAALDRWDQR